MWSHNEPAPQVEARIVIVLCEATIRRRRQPNSVFAERGYILGRQPKWCKLAAVAGVLWPALVPGSVAVMVRLKSDCVGQRGLAAVMAWLARRGCSPAAAGLLPHSPRLPPGAGGLVAQRPLGALACQPESGDSPGGQTGGRAGGFHVEQWTWRWHRSPLGQKPAYLQPSPWHWCPVLPADSTPIERVLSVFWCRYSSWSVPRVKFLNEYDNLFYLYMYFTSFVYAVSDMLHFMCPFSYSCSCIYI